MGAVAVRKLKNRPQSILAFSRNQHKSTYLDHLNQDTNISAICSDVNTLFHENRKKKQFALRSEKYRLLSAVNGVFGISRRQKVGWNIRADFCLM
jgi:hypothetical protein